WNAAEAFGERLGVAVRAAGADLRATADGVPGGVGPLDGGERAHGELLWRFTFNVRRDLRTLNVNEKKEKPRRPVLRSSFGGTRPAPLLADVASIRASYFFFSSTLGWASGGSSSLMSWALAPL